MGSAFGLFHRYWREWDGKLRLPIERNGSKLFFPPNIEEVATNSGSVQFKPTYPVLIYNAPQKASSQRRGPSHQQAIFIDGLFVLKLIEDGPLLVEGRCSATFFETMQQGNGACLFSEIDAVHFDMERSNAQSPNHPIFHAQFDRSQTLTDTQICDVVDKLVHIKADVKRNSCPRLHQLRLPTPQMDMFSVLTMTIADFFCNGGDSDIRVKDQFQAVLSHLSDRRNAARVGLAARTLRDRAGSSYPAIVHWYPECSGLAG